MKNFAQEFTKRNYIKYCITNCNETIIIQSLVITWLSLDEDGDDDKNYHDEAKISKSEPEPDIFLPSRVYDCVLCKTNIETQKGNTLFNIWRFGI